MDASNSILDRVLEKKQVEDLYQFDPKAVLSVLFSELQDREREVLVCRFGLDGNDPKTLENIGKDFGVTRERVRQIETGSIKKLMELKTIENDLKYIQTVIHQLLDQHGGVLEESHLLEMLLAHKEDSRINRAIILFFVEKLLVNKFDRFHDADKFHRSWKVVTADSEKIEQDIKVIHQLIKDHGDPIEEDELVQKILEEIDHLENEDLIRGHLRISKKLKQNIFGKWGHHKWSSISPKRMNDKIYLVLQHVGEPMHFTDISEKINELGFDHKVAYPATVHNELILDKKYVLVGRGIYALKEWGYKPGVVADVIERILKSSEQPLSREDIVEKVLEQRIVGKSTIHLSLMNKDKFSKSEDGRYSLRVI